MNKTDEELIEGYLDGNQEYFKILIDRYTPSIYGFSVRFAGVYNASDIVQEVFIKVWKNIKKFNKEKASFKTWLWIIVRNTVTDFLRKKKLFSFTELERIEGESVDNIFVDDTVLPDEIIQKLQDKEVLDKALENISLNYREILVLYYEEGMTFFEIGEILGKPLNTVKSHHRRALIELRKIIGEL